MPFQNLNALVGSRSSAGRSYFTYEGGRFGTVLPDPGGLRPTFVAMVDELIEWRLAEYLARGGPAEGDEEFAPSSDGTTPSALGATGPEHWREYMREEIPPLFGLKFSTGSWNQGFVVQGKNVFLLATLDKSDLQQDHKYDDGFLSPSRFRWQSQNRTTQRSTHGQIIRQALPGYAIHLLVRATKKRGQSATPFIYCGEIDFSGWSGEAPITVEWKLRHPVPAHLLRTLKVP